MLLATALCGVLLAALWMLMGTYGELFDKGQQQVERAQLCRALLQQMADDLRSAIQDPLPGMINEAAGAAQRRRFGLFGSSRELRFDVLQLTPQQANPIPVGRAAGGADETKAARVPELARCTTLSSNQILATSWRDRARRGWCGANWTSRRRGRALPPWGWRRRIATGSQAGRHGRQRASLIRRAVRQRTGISRQRHAAVGSGSCLPPVPLFRWPRLDGCVEQPGTEIAASGVEIQLQLADCLH